MRHYGDPLSDPRKQIQALLIQKGHRASMGDLHGARQIDLAIRKILLDAKLPFEIDATKITLHGATKLALERESKRRHAMLVAYGVPDWFRPGYAVPLRVKLWRRLRPDFRARLKRRHDLGLLSVYFPSPSFWAKLIRPSDYMKRQASEPEAVDKAVSAIQTTAAYQPGTIPVLPAPQVAEEVVVAMDDADASVAAVANIEQELSAEEDDAAALAESIAMEGPAVLTSNAPWYEDRQKVLYAAIGGLILFSVLRK